ncbi:MAG: DUF4031 domain-containing protein [bacterium]
MDKPNGEGWAHLLSDQPGKEGSEELRNFARRIGLFRRLQSRGTYAEHYDIRESDIPRAGSAGAEVVSRRKLAEILRKKRTLMGSKYDRPGSTSKSRAQ